MEIQQYQGCSCRLQGCCNSQSSRYSKYHCYSEWKDSNLQSNRQECNVHQQNSSHCLCWRNTGFLYTESNICNRWNCKICNKQQERCDSKFQRCCNSKESRYSSDYSYSRKGKDYLQSNCQESGYCSQSSKNNYLYQRSDQHKDHSN